MRQRTLGTKLLLAAVTLGVLAYFGLQAFQYFTDPLTTTPVYNYSVDRSVSMSGYVVRQELVLESSEGLLQLQRAEGERVSTGGTVAVVYSDQDSMDPADGDQGPGVPAGAAGVCPAGLPDRRGGSEAG